MCLGAIYWARPKAVYYANTRRDAANIGFDDELIYSEIGKQLDERKMKMHCLGREDAIKLFEEWNEREEKNVH
jgi:tRNA(Arg) A34 adenosine deaminase TadA